MANLEQFKVGKVSPMKNPETGKLDISFDDAEDVSRGIVKKRELGVINNVDARFSSGSQISSKERIASEVRRVEELCKKYMDEENPNSPINVIKVAYANRDLSSARAVSQRVIEEIQQHLDFMKTGGNIELENAKKKLESVREYYIQRL